ncbi:MAG: beta-ketoacyl-[acyl-carrier-protein] synthase II [Chloroflexi bacterium]|nr:beta-ketoacyl-[acyl-carrier-protein] synthase II [Chloroflexota bacterium]
MNTSRKRVVVTGLGAITPLGLTVTEFWDGLSNSRSGINRITQFDATGFDCQIAGEVKGFDPAKYMDHKEARRMARCSQFAIAAAKDAIGDAGLSYPFEDAMSERVGVLIGTAIGGFEKGDEAVNEFRSKKSVRAGPFAITGCIPNAPAFHVARTFLAHGPLLTLVTACATGTQSLGEATEIIRRGAADIPIHYNDAPEKASRPFDKDREGFVFSEGCGVVVLEELEHAKARGAKIYCEVVGAAASSDAFHVAQPDPSAQGAIRSMTWALRDAQVDPKEVGYINAHGSSTPINDPLETMAIKKVFGEAAYNIPVTSTKSMIGHPMGASGALEAIACIKTIETGVIHPTLNLDTPDPECDLDYVPNVARQANVRVTLSNSFGLGGQNACLVLRKFEN